MRGQGQRKRNDRAGQHIDRPVFANASTGFASRQCSQSIDWVGTLEHDAENGWECPALGAG
jgi:hypothetical protein